MLRRFRLLLPPPFILGTFIALALFLVALFLLVPWQPWSLAATELAALTVTFTVIYAGYRGLKFHPALNPGYRRWLALSPWDHRHPLPLGPALPCWGDLVIVGCLLAVVQGLIGPLKPPFPPAVLVLGPVVVVYVLALIQALRRNTHGWPWNHAALDSLFIAASLWPWPWHAISALGLALLCTCWGVSRTLRAFRDWPDDDNPPIRLDTPFETPGNKPGDLGWPWNRLGPLPLPKEGEALNWADHLLKSLTPALALLAFLRFPRDDNGFAMGVGILVAAGLVPLFRLGIYAAGYKPPINLAGRFRVHGGIIRGYDQVFVGPLCSLLALVLLPSPLMKLGVPIPAAFALTLFVCLYFILSSKPSLYHWRLTGRHRITHELTEAQKEFIQTG